MPSSQTTANERRNERTITHEPPKLKTTLKTPPKQATNPLQFVKVGPCSLYRTAQEQLQKVQEVKKIKQTVRDDPEDWQSNLDNWKSSRRKRQEHIIERVVEVKKLELEEHDRQRRRSKTFSEMMEERGNRGRKLSMSLAMYHEEDSNDLSDLGIGTSSGKSSISGDTHDDAQSVLSDRDSELDKNHSDVDTAIENSNVDNNNVNLKKISNTLQESKKKLDCRRPDMKDYNYEKYSETTVTCSPRKNADYSNDKSNFGQTRSFVDNKHDLVKVDVLKRREIFEMASQNDNMNDTINNFIKDKLSSIETYKNDTEQIETNKTMKRLSGDMSSVRDRLSQLEREVTEREKENSNKSMIEKIEPIRPVKDRLLVLEKCESNISASTSKIPVNNTEINELTLTINNCLSGLNDVKSDDSMEKYTEKLSDNVNKSEDNKLTCSSPEIDYHATRAVFHRSLDSLDVAGSNEPNTFERVQSFEELNYNRMRYFVTAASGEILNDTDREDSGIQTADVSCSVSQADEPVDEDPVQNSLSVGPIDEINSDNQILEQRRIFNEVDANEKTEIVEKYQEKVDVQLQTPVIIEEPIVIVNSEHEETVARSKSPTSVELEEVVETSEPTVEITCYDLPVPCPNITQPTPPSTLRPKPRQFKPLHLDKTCDNLPVVMEFIDTSVTLPISPFNLDNNEEIVAGITFPLGPPTSVEPPKEKPPPPPTDVSDDENQSIEPLKRLNSTRRIKKELRTRRSDFLGIEGITDYDLELNLTKPPDIAAILAEERRIEQLHRRSYDTDSNYEQDSSHERDSGVELGHAEEWTKQPVSPDMSQHSRQSSEPFGASVTSSEEDEITKKEREIIEVLEREEAWRYGSDREQNSDIGEKLAHKLRELEEEKMQLERERAQEDENVRKNDEEVLQPDVKQQEVERANDMKFPKNDITIKLEQLRLKNDDPISREEKTTMATMICEHEDDYSCGEVRRVERELLQLEQEELKRQRANTAYREAKQQQFIQLTDSLQEQWPSLQNINDMSNMAYATYENVSIVNLRASMPNLQLQDSQRRRPPPPPIPPAKPLRLIDQRQRDLTIRNSRIPSADSIPQQMDGTYPNVPSMSTQPGQQMSKQTLQALSAVPRPRIFKGDQWVQRRRSDGVQVTQDLNYQHWLIQEAELRRINEKHQRSYATKPLHHSTGTSVPYSPASSTKSEGKPLPDSIIQTLTQRMHNRAQERPVTFRKRAEYSISQEHLPLMHHPAALEHHVPIHQSPAISSNAESQDKMLSVSGKKKCSHCCDELGRGAAMIIESLRLFYHMECFKCCVCHVRLGDGRMGTDVRVRNHKLHCHNCYSSDDGVKFSCV